MIACGACFPGSPTREESVSFIGSADRGRIKAGNPSVVGQLGDIISGVELFLPKVDADVDIVDDEDTTVGADDEDDDGRFVDNPDPLEVDVVLVVLPELLPVEPPPEVPPLELPPELPPLDDPPVVPPPVVPPPELPPLDPPEYAWALQMLLYQ